MSCLRRYTKPADGTIPVPALLYDDEELLASQAGVGIYDGPQKSPDHQSGTLHATTHRLFYIDTPHPNSHSFAFDLSHVARTEYYAGLFTSSSKVTLYLHALPSPSRSDLPGSTAESSGPEDDVFVSWECEVCSHRNPPGLSPAASKICALCGVPRASIKPQISGPIHMKPNSAASLAFPPHFSSSLPSSTANLPKMSSSSGSTPPRGRADDNAANGEVACPACTFLNHPSLNACEICGTTLPRSLQSSVRPMAKSAPASRPASPLPEEEEGDGPRMIRLSFRKGGDKAFYTTLRRSLLARGWEGKEIGKPSISSPESHGLASNQATIGHSGINSILRTVETTATTTQNSMEDALQDLEALMVKAKDMVKLAEDLNERLTVASAASSRGSAFSATGTSSTPVEPEEATFIRSSLAQLGLQMTNAPVTLDMMQDERRWIEELARELADILQGSPSSGYIDARASWELSQEDVRIGKGGKAGRGGMMRQRGVVGLDEVWGGWNRARGVALIPPSTFLLVLQQLPMYTSPPVQMRTFPATGLSVLHTPSYSKAAFAARLGGFLALSGPSTTIDIAQEEELPVGLAQEMIREVEDAGDICRDQGGSGIGALDPGTGAHGLASEAEIRWWVNIFRGYVWDGQVP